MDACWFLRRAAVVLPCLVVGAGALPACSESNVPTGTYVAESSTVQRLGPTRARRSTQFRRGTSTFGDVEDCPFGAGALPAEVTQGLGAKTMEDVVSGPNLEFVSGERRVRVETVVDLGTRRCAVRKEETYTKDGTTYRLADGSTVEVSHGGDALTVVHDETLPEGFVERRVSLWTDAAFAWIEGDWALATDARNVLRVRRSPPSVTLDQVKQVGRKDDPGVPFPTVCHLRWEVASPAFDWEDRNTPTSSLQLTGEATAFDVVKEAGTPAACDEHVRRRKLENDGKPRLHLRLKEMSPDQLVVSGHLYVRVAQTP